MARYAGLNGIGVVDGTQSTLTFPTTRNIEPGEHVVCLTGNNGGSVNTTSVAVGALSLARDVNITPTFTHLELWSGRATAQILSGANIVVTLPSPVTICIHAICGSFAGVKATGFLGTTATNSVAGTGPGAGPTAATTDILGVSVGGVRTDSHDETTFLPSFGYTSVGEIHDATADMGMSLTYLLDPPLGTLTAAWTLSVGSGCDTVVAYYLPSTQSLAWTRA